MHKLIIQDDEGKTTVVPLIRDEITIGRKEGNTIRLTERNVSRRHARILKSNGAVFLEDLDSYNGVRVNGQRIQGRVAVTEQDRIQIGDYLLELRVDRGAQDAFSVPSGTQTAPMEVVSVTDLQSMPPPPPMPSVNGGQVHSVTASMHAQNYASPVMDVSPSMPGHATAPMPVAETPARLFVVSQNFAGREFVLDKPAMVIGRTDDNDVVVNHRSISRHHAKIVLEQGRYAIVDLQSANGVRVNGEEYGKVELRRGDVIDLGHVRLRYVEAGEDFVFERDAQVVEVSTRGRKKGGKGLIVGTLAVLVVAGVAGVFVATRPAQTGGAAVAQNPSNPPPTAPVAAVEHPVVAKAPDAAPVAVKPPDVPVAPPQPPTPTAPDPTKLLDEARQALTEERWVSALAAAEQALKIDPANAEAKKIQEKANAEFRNQTTYEKLVEQKDAGKIAEAMKHFQEIPEGSYYREKAKPAIDEMRDAFVKEKEGEARALKDRGQCDRIAGLARRSADVFPEAKAKIEKAGAGCTQVAVKDPVRPERPDTPTTPDGAADPDALLKEAKEAVRQQHWPGALKKAADVLKARPDDRDALVIAAYASCYLAEKGKALKYYNRLPDPTRKNMVKQLCTQVNIFLDEE